MCIRKRYAIHTHEVMMTYRLSKTNENTIRNCTVVELIFSFLELLGYFFYLFMSWAGHTEVKTQKRCAFPENNRLTHQTIFINNIC